MPMITAANAPYNPIPQQSPAPTTGNDFQNITGATPEAFGAGIGEAESKLGGTLEKTGDMLAQHVIKLQEQKNQSDANEKFLQAMIETGDKEAKFKALTGKDAIAAYPQYQSDILDLRNKYKADLNPMASKLFDQQYTRRAGFLISDGAGHAALEQRRAFVATNKAIQYNAVGDIAQNPNDEVRFTQNLDTIRQHAIDEMGVQGYPKDDPVTTSHVNKAVSEAYERRIFEISKSNPAEASRIFRDNQKSIVDPVIREKIQGHITQGFLQNGTREDAEAILQGRTPNGLLSLGGDVGTNAVLVRKYESEKLAQSLGISPYVIGVGGTDLTNAKLDENGFPIWGGKGDSHAAGAYQFQPKTWATYAKQLGIHDFSPASQDRVFAAAHAAEGWGPWAPFNPALAAAIKNKESGVQVASAGAVIPSGRKNVPVYDTDDKKYNLTPEQYEEYLGLPEDKQVDYLKNLPAPGSTPPSVQGPPANLDEALKRADAVADRYVANGLIGGNTGIPEAQVREELKTRIRSQYNMSAQGVRDINRLKFYAARNSALSVDSNGEPVYKSLDQFLGADENREVYNALDDVGKAAVRNQIANNAKVVPMTPERIEAWEKLRDMHIAAPDEFVKIDPLTQDLPVSYKMRLANMIRETEHKAQNPDTWRHDLNKALTQIKQEGLIMNTGIDPASKTDERSHRFVASLGRQMQEFEQEKKRPMNPDEVRKTVAGLMRTAVPWSWKSPFSGSQQGFEVFVPKAFRDEFTSKFKTRWGGAPSTQQLVDAYHASDEYKKQGPTEVPEEPGGAGVRGGAEPNP